MVLVFRWVLLAAIGETFLWDSFLPFVTSRRDSSGALQGRTPFTDSLNRWLYAEVNRYRKARGLPGLVWHEGAVAIAQAYAVRMAEEDFFGHKAPTGEEVDVRLTRAGIAWTACGENLARNRGYPQPAARALQGWIRSPSHRANILNPAFTHTGIAAYRGADGTYFFVQIFLRPP